MASDGDGVDELYGCLAHQLVPDGDWVLRPAGSEALAGKNR